MIITLEKKVIHHLKKDKKLVSIIENCPVEISMHPTSVFEELLRSIVSQQLSTKVAATIYRRFLDLFDDIRPLGDQIDNLSIQDLRSVGLSERKAEYIKNVEHHFRKNNLHHTDWSQWTDEEIIDELVKIKGVGKWTAEMILMFSLFREDVLPLDDLIIRTHMIRLYSVKSEKKQLIEDLTKIAEPWRPYRSYACLYLWSAKGTPYIPDK